MCACTGLYHFCYCGINTRKNYHSDNSLCTTDQLMAMWLLANGHAGKFGHPVVLQSEREDLWKSGEGFCRPDDFPVIQSKAFKALKKT